MGNMNAEQALNLRDEKEQAKAAGAKVNILDEIRRMEPQYQAAMPKGAEAAQLVRDAITLVKTTPKLFQCERVSVLSGLMTIAQLNLRVGVLGQAWLLPLKNKKEGTLYAQLVIGYQGYIELALRSPNVAGIIARTAYENDLFDVQLGTDDRIIHRPVMDGPRGAPIAYYAVVKYANGGHTFWWMTKAEMERHRDRFALAKTYDGKIVGPWVNNEEAMSQKTVVRQLAKYMPKSTELAQAIAADESVRLDLDPATSPAEAAQFIDGEVVDDEPRQESAG
jgi:recombination protein RecT